MPVEPASQVVGRERARRYRLERQRVPTVPVAVEQRRQARQHRADNERVEVDEVDAVALHEVFVSDVASAGNRHGAVGDQQLVVHAPVDAAEVEQRGRKAPAKAASSGRKRVEQAQLDVRVRGEAGQQLVLSRGVEIVEQQANAHAAPRGVAQQAEEGAAGFVVVDVIALHVERMAGAAHQLQPSVQRHLAAGHEVKAAQRGVGLGRSSCPDQRRRGVRRQRHCARTRRLGRQAGAAGGQDSGADQQTVRGASDRGRRDRGRSLWSSCEPICGLLARHSVAKRTAHGIAIRVSLQLTSSARRLPGPCRSSPSRRRSSAPRGRRASRVPPLRDGSRCGESRTGRRWSRSE